MLMDNTRDENFFWYSLKNSIFSFYCSVYTPMRASDATTNVTKQNMNVMAPHSVRWRDKNKTFLEIKIILLPKCSLHSI